MSIHSSNLSLLPGLCQDTSICILSFLKKENIAVLGGVSRTWLQLTTQDILWQEIAFNRLGGIWPRQLPSRLNWKEFVMKKCEQAALEQKESSVFFKTGSSKFFVPFKRGVKALKIIGDQLIVVGESSSEIRVLDLKNKKLLYSLHYPSEMPLYLLDYEDKLVVGFKGSVTSFL